MSIWFQSWFQNTLRFTQRHKVLLSAILAIFLLNHGWNELTRTRGAQKVAFTPATQSCGEIAKLRYCTYSAQAGTNGDLVYHFHGRKLDETIWNDDTYYTSLVQSQWQKTGTLPPKVVSISYGSNWLLAPRGQKPESGLLEDFMANMPAIEKVVGKPKQRILLGESMGGLNVLVAGLTYPDQFSKIASLCPGVYANSPFDSLSTMHEAARRTGGNPKIAFGIWMLARRYVANQEEWKHFSPLELINKADETYPKLYLSNGLYDSYGNYEGSEKLAKIATEKGIETTWRPLYGGHCAIDAPSLAAFLSTQ
jgi:enterochelin esterase-like enzyme